MIASLLMFVTLALAGETVWATEDVQTQRFPNDDVEGPFLSEGDELEVILREEGRVRVRKDDEYGWLDAGKITDQAPADEPE